MCAAKRMNEAERKKEIMNSAMKIISTKGLTKTTMEDIIAGTTLSKGGVYHYYKSVNEVFKDIMILGMEYRNKIIQEHLIECKKGFEKEFIAKQIVDKIIDENPYMPLYVEFLIAKKRNPELNKIMIELQEQTKQSLKTIMKDVPEWLFNPNGFQFISDFINTLLLASNVLDARENFKKNRRLLEEMFIYIFNQRREDFYESL